MNIQEAYEQVFKFNKIAGVLDSPTYDTVDMYNSLGFEEMSESITALEEGNKVEVLDGCLDEFFIICGKMQILEKMGYNVQEGLKRVCENNLSKFPSVVDGCTRLKEYTATVNKEYNVYVIKDINGKVRKPEGFVPVDISDLVPGGAI